MSRDNVPTGVLYKGINAFDNAASLRNVSVIGSGGQGGNEYIISLITTILENPSNVSLLTNNIALPVIYQGVSIGRAAINVSHSSLLRS